MKLESIHIENFRSLKKIDISFNSDMNLLVGKNNSGKSNIIYGLLWVRDFVINGYQRKLFLDNVYGKNQSSIMIFILNFIISTKERDALISQLSAEGMDEKAMNSFGDKIKYSLKFNSEKIIDESVYLFIDGVETIFAAREEGGSSVAKGVQSGSTTNGKKFSFSPMVLAPGGGFESIINRSHSMDWQKTLGDNLLELIWRFMEEIYYLNANRFSEAIKIFEGNYKLNDDASNLPQVLSTIANSDKKCYNRIMMDIKEILEDIEEINTPPIDRAQDGKQNIQIVVEEKHFPSIWYSWSNISSGTKELIYQITQLNLSRKGSFLIIEEPEIHLHALAIKKFVNILKTKAENEDKQILITSHSPVFMDQLKLENLIFIARDYGESIVIPVTDVGDMEKVLQEEGLSIGFLFGTEHPSILLIVEGVDDHKIYEEFIRKSSIDIKKEKIIIINPEKEGGYTEAIKYGKFLNKARTGIPFLVLLDSDTGKEKEEKQKLVSELKPGQFYILSNKDIEDYLIDVQAISSMANRDQDEIRKKIDEIGGAGKEKLEKILNSIDKKPTAEVKALIVSHMENFPEEIKGIIDLIKKEARIPST